MPQLSSEFCRQEQSLILLPVNTALVVTLVFSIKSEVFGQKSMPVMTSIAIWNSKRNRFCWKSKKDNAKHMYSTLDVIISFLYLSKENTTRKINKLSNVTNDLLWIYQKHISG